MRGPGRCCFFFTESIVINPPVVWASITYYLTMTLVTLSPCRRMKTP